MKLFLSGWLVAALAALLLLSGCTVPPLLPDDTLLPNLNLQTITTTENAREAMATVATVRANLAFDTRQAEITCYKKFYVNACLSDVDVLRKRKESRLREIDLVAQQVVRNERTLEKNESIAKSEADRDKNAPAQAQRREESLEKALEKQESVALKAEQLKEKQAADSQRAVEIENARKAKEIALKERDAKVKAAQSSEASNKAKYQNKVATTKAKQAKALAKSALIAGKPKPAPRIAKKAKSVKAEAVKAP
jgi:colicin import membrane protein